jgi:hypothetical protein
MPKGALLDPTGAAHEALTPDEYKTLRACLAVGRREPESAFKDALRLIEAWANDEPDTPYLSLLATLAARACDHPGDDWNDGVLVCRGSSRSSIPLWENAFDDVVNFVKVLRKGGWFADWLMTQCAFVASGEPYPTPLQIAGTFGEAIESFDAAAEAAREFYGLFPGVLRSTEPMEVK